MVGKRFTHVTVFSRNELVSVCGGRLAGSTGTITSPGYPRAYPHNRLCTWTIVAPEGRRVSLEILDFDIEGFGFCQADVVEVIAWLLCCLNLLVKWTNLVDFATSTVFV